MDRDRRFGHALFLSLSAGSRGACPLCTNGLKTHYVIPAHAGIHLFSPSEIAGWSWTPAYEEMLSIWEVAVSETRRLLDGPWP
jgi:hypothetical protein